nr:putative F-box protein At3g52320 [Ipomoea batatas]
MLSDASPSLPDDTVAKILSWLPVKSLLRFKCVCKKWRQLIQQDDFVENHHRRAAICFYYHLKYILSAEFWCIDVQKGLLLEHEHCKDPTERLCIRNPATRQSVYLSELRVGDDSPIWVVARMFFVAKSINECTIISFSESEESVLMGRFRAITVGVDAAWRPLKNSPPNSTHYISNAWKSKIYSLRIENIFYVVTMDADDKKILWVDAEDESVKAVKIPENLFSDWSYVTPREWNSKLSLVYNKGDLIDICVLSKNEWAKSQTVDVATFTLDYPIPFITEETKIWMKGIGRRETVEGVSITKRHIELFLLNLELDCLLPERLRTGATSLVTNFDLQGARRAESVKLILTGRRLSCLTGETAKGISLSHPSLSLSLTFSAAQSLRLRLSPFTPSSLAFGAKHNVDLGRWA